MAIQEDTAAISPMMEGAMAQFMRGVDLFNAGQFFECHEVLEEIWLMAEGPERELLHALIQSAAALHHFQRGNSKGALSVFRRARGKLEKLPPRILRLDTRKFAESLDCFFAMVLDRQTAVTAFPKIQLQDE